MFVTPPSPWKNVGVSEVSMENAMAQRRQMDAGKNKGCTDCEGCDHCSNCVSCNNCGYCKGCRSCSTCAYSANCVDCTRCFRCKNLTETDSVSDSFSQKDAHDEVIRTAF